MLSLREVSIKKLQSMSFQSLPPKDVPIKSSGMKDSESSIRHEFVPLSLRREGVIDYFDLSLFQLSQFSTLLCIFALQWTSTICTISNFWGHNWETSLYIELKSEWVTDDWLKTTYCKQLFLPNPTLLTLPIQKSPPQFFTPLPRISFHLPKN